MKCKYIMRPENDVNGDEVDESFNLGQCQHNPQEIFLSPEKMSVLTGVSRRYHIKFCFSQTGIGYDISNIPPEKPEQTRLIVSLQHTQKLNVPHRSTHTKNKNLSYNIPGSSLN